MQRLRVDVKSLLLGVILNRMTEETETLILILIVFILFVSDWAKVYEHGPKQYLKDKLPVMIISLVVGYIAAGLF